MTPAPHPADQQLPGLAPATQGELRLADALARVTDHADPEWWAAALTAVAELAGRYRGFTSDQVWDTLAAQALTPHEPRALGAVMRVAARARLVAPTDRYVPSERPQAHRRPVRVWRSVLLTEGDHRG